jgi:transcriptional regulator of nitric oxide reductase/ferredoxin
MSKTVPAVSATAASPPADRAAGAEVRTTWPGCKEVALKHGNRTTASLALWLVLAVMLAASSDARADGVTAGEVDWRAAFARVLPEADAFGDLAGEPRAMPGYRDGRLIGYAFLTREVVASEGFSGKPLNLAVGLDLDGRITGAEIVEHHEPILTIGVSDADLNAYVDQYLGWDVRQPATVVRHGRGGPDEVDAVAGATISSVVLNDAILRAGRAVARSRGLLGLDQARLDFESFAPADWPALVAEGSLPRLTVTVAQLKAAMEPLGGRYFAPGAEPADAQTPFLDLYFGLATPARMGRNLLSGHLYNRVVAQLSESDQVIFVAGGGLYSFKGTGYVRDGRFDRLQIVQADKTFVFEADDHVRIDMETYDAPGAPGLREAALFILPAAGGFRPEMPWRLEILVKAKDPAGAPVFASFGGEYRLPAVYVRDDPAAAEEELRPLWQDVWLNRKVDIAVLCAALLVLTAILFFQEIIERRRTLYLRIRDGFLIFTLLWLGWYAGAQLSVLQVLTFAEALRTQFHWDFFLLDPLLFLLWSFVAVAMLFWGRGVFCGWLCPFGALQELSHKVAKWARIPDLRVPFTLHERLWPIKYVIFLVLVALSLGATDLAQTGAEVEPFKTAIVLQFARDWRFALYPAALILAGLFIPRFYCRYLCALGGALAIPARLRTFEWLKRRWQCGTQCQICAIKCPVQAIHPDGRINPNECIHCLNCQTHYYDAFTCPPLIERRKRRERRGGIPPSVSEPG